MPISHKVTDNLYLVVQDLPSKPVTKPVPAPVNHILVLDCSGSMSGELPEIRTQLKRKLPRLLGEHDTLSIVWFSGRGEFGTLLENEPVSTLADLQAVEKAIDRWLKPVGLTGFREPIEEVGRLTEKIAKARPGSVFSLFFMSDGQDNCSDRREIIETVEKVSGSLSAATFVEYGYYADRPLLTQMAEKSGGTLIFAEDFDRYEPALEAALTKKILSAKRVELPIQGDPIGGFVFALGDGDITTYRVENGTAMVPETLTSVGYVCTSPVGESHPNNDTTTAYLYGAMSLYGARMKSDVILGLLRGTGDVAFIEQYAGLFGKQAYSDFMETTRAAAFDATKRLTKGCDPNRIPREDAYTVLDFLRDLAGNNENRLLLDHETFRYNRIGRARVDATTVMTQEDRAAVTKLTDEMQTAKDPKRVSELALEIAALTSKPEALRFNPTPAPDGYSVMNLTYNEDRPNISVLVKRTGTVDLSGRNPPEGIPQTLETFVYRNYAVVKDGLVNVKTLPCRLSGATREILAGAIRDGRAPEGFLTQEGEVVLVHLDKLPVINRQMVREVSAKSFFEKQYELTRVQAAAKVYRAFLKEHGKERKSEGFGVLYGEANAEWLKLQGITDYGGFAPKSVQSEATDFYLGKELKVSLKGLSSLPTLKVARENIQKGKINAPTALMRTAIEAVDTFMSSEAYQSAPNQADLLETWLEGQAESASLRAKQLQREIAEVTLTLVVGQVWFSEFSSLDEGSLDIQVDGQTISCKVEQKSIEIRI